MSTTLPKELLIIETPKVLAIGESRAYTIDFTSLGTPDAAGTTVAEDATGADKTADVLAGSNSLTGNVVTMPTLTPATEQTYRLTCQITIGGATAYGILDVVCIETSPAVYTPGANSYGTLAGVGALSPRFASKLGIFDMTTRPTGQQVINYIDQVSSTLNTALAAEGFAVPITDADVTPMLVFFVEQEVASIVEGINGSGRFGPTRRRGAPASRWAIISDDVIAFIKMNAVGFERMGATRTYSIGDEIAYRETDESGDSVPPLFQREGFGETYKDWD